MPARPMPRWCWPRLDHDASPLLLISTLADHTRNIAADPRVSLLFDGTAGLDEPLTGPRVSGAGPAARTDDPRHRARYPRAPSGRGDVCRTSRISASIASRSRAPISSPGSAASTGSTARDLVSTRRRALAEHEAGDRRAHERRPCRRGAALCAHGSSARTGEGWRMTGIDPEGIDLRRAGDGCPAGLRGAGPRPRTRHGPSWCAWSSTRDRQTEQILRRQILLAARETSNIPGQRLQFNQGLGGCMILSRSVARVLFATFILLFSAAGALAAPDPAAAAGNTAWILTATALVLFMTLPGLALFYGGLVRAKNVLSVLMHCFAIGCLVSVLWMVAGYSLAFGDEPWLDRRARQGCSSPASARMRSSGTARDRLRHVPDDLRDHHPGADHRRLPGAHEVPVRAALLRALAAAGLRAGRPLGLGRRLARDAGRDRLRRRHRRAHHGGRLGAGLRADDRRAPRLPQPR